MMNQIILCERGNSYFGCVASKYVYTDYLQARLADIMRIPADSDNKFWVLEGAVVVAGQSTLKGALRYMTESRVLVTRENVHGVTLAHFDAETLLNEPLDDPGYDASTVKI